MSHEEIVARAQVVLRESLAQLLADSPLGEIERWVAEGAPPPVRTLRDAGLCGLQAPETTESGRLRSAFFRNWGYSIPCAEAVAAIRALASPIVEIGAGTGYWTTLLQAAGLDVVGTDISIEGEARYGFRLSGRASLQAMDALQAVAAFPDRDLFCSWPGQGEAWCADAVEALAPGRSAILIAEPRGGLTGSDRLFDVLEADFDLEAEVEIPQFPGRSDRLTIHRRR